MVIGSTSLPKLRNLLLGGATALALSSCRSPEDLLKTVNAVILVVGVDDNDFAVIDVAGESRQSEPTADDVVEFKLALPEGRHEGSVTVVEVKGGDDDEEEEEEDDSRRCGLFTIVVKDGEIAAAGIVAEDLPRCDDDDDDGEEGEGEDIEGEGEDEPEGEGEDEPDGEGEDEPDGEGEGE